MRHANAHIDATCRRPRSGAGLREDLQRLVDRVAGYLRSRSKEEWMIFLAGVILGLILG